MAFGDQTPGWWFYGRLRPTAATRFNVQEVPVAPGVRLEVFHDAIAMWSKSGPNAIHGPQEPNELFALVLGAYALITGVALDWSLDGWVEATGARFDGTMMGVVVDPRGHDPMLSPRSRRSVDMRRAARLAISVRSVPSYRLALRDIYAAFHDRGDDAFVFAYRAIEDVARAVSGRRGDLRPSDWRALHDHLGTDEEAFTARIRGLQDARNAAAHGDEQDAELLAARADRDARIEIARQVVAETLAADERLPFELRFLR